MGGNAGGYGSCGEGGGQPDGLDAGGSLSTIPDPHLPACEGGKTLNLRLPPPTCLAVTSLASAGRNSPALELRRGGGLESVPEEAADDGHGGVASKHLLVPGRQRGLGGANLVPLVSSSWAVSCGEDGICSSGDPGGAANGVVRLPPQTDACLVCLEPSRIDLETSSNQCYCFRIHCATFCVCCFCFRINMIFIIPCLVTTILF